MLLVLIINIANMQFFFAPNVKCIGWLTFCLSESVIWMSSTSCAPSGWQNTSSWSSTVQVELRTAARFQLVKRNRRPNTAKGMLPCNTASRAYKQNAPLSGCYLETYLTKTSKPRSTSRGDHKFIHISTLTYKCIQTFCETLRYPTADCIHINQDDQPKTVCNTKKVTHLYLYIIFL